MRSGQNNTTLPLSFSEGHLHKDVILPFLVGIKCCGFYLYGTPLIYTQEMKGERKDSWRVNAGATGASAEHTLARFGSSAGVNMESDTLYPDPFSDNWSLPNFSSVNPMQQGNYPQ